MSAYGERIARLEERVEKLEEAMGRVEDKLDQLLTLKDKGAGAFWLIGIIAGSGVVTLLANALHWFRS